MNRIKQISLDYYNILQTNLKLMLNHRVATLVLIVGTFLVLGVSASLIGEAEDKSSIPIGIIDYDQSIHSRELTEKIKKIQSFYVVEDSKKGLDKSIKDERIMAYFTIKKGYEKNIESGKTKGLIDIYYLKQKAYVSILSDIFASEMIDDIAFYKSLRLYQSFDDKYDLISEKEYQTYLDNIGKKYKNGFSFDIEYLNVIDHKITEVTISNGLLLKQIVFDLVAVLFSFIIMFLIYSIMKENNLNRRIRLTMLNRMVLENGNVCSIMFVMGIIIIIFTSFLYYTLGFNHIGLYVSTMLVATLFCFFITEFFLLLAALLKSSTSYQLVGSLFIILFGGLAGISLFGSLLPEKILQLLKIIPNCWFITGLTDIIVNKSSFFEISQVSKWVLIIWFTFWFLKFCILFIKDKYSK